MSRPCAPGVHDLGSVPVDPYLQNPLELPLGPYHVPCNVLPPRKRGRNWHPTAFPVQNRFRNLVLSAKLGRPDKTWCVAIASHFAALRAGRRVRDRKGYHHLVSRGSRIH